MAIVGNNPASPNIDYTRSMVDAIRAFTITMPEAANGAASIWWYGSTVAGSSVHAAIYDVGTEPAKIVNEVSTYSPGALTDQWHEIPLNTTVLANATDYRLCIRHDAGDGRLAYNNGGGITNGERDDYTGAAYMWDSGWNDPAGASFPSAIDSREWTIYLEYTPAPSGITGASATTNANDSQAAAGELTSSGSAATNNANDSQAAAGELTNSGTAATINAEDTQAAAGELTNAGTSATTNANDSQAAAGTVTTPGITGIAVSTNANDSQAAGGILEASGAATTINTNDSQVASGIVGTVISEPGQIFTASLPLRTFTASLPLRTFKAAQPLRTFKAAV